MHLSGAAGWPAITSLPRQPHSLGLALLSARAAGALCLQCDLMLAKGLFLFSGSRGVLQVVGV